MPALAPSYVFSFFALITVSSILISSFTAFATTLRAMPEKVQLQNLMNHTAVKGYELTALVIATNSSSETIFEMPSSIGKKPYWIRLCNGTSSAWVEGGLGSQPNDNVINRIYFPKSVIAEGSYVSGYGPAVLSCDIDGSRVHLELASWSD